MSLARQSANLDDPDATSVKAWLLDEALSGASQHELLQGYCRRLVDLDIPLVRFHLAQRAFHPQYGGLGFNWTRKDGLSHDQYGHQNQPLDIWVRSPLYHMLETRADELHISLEDLQVPSRFPFLDELKQRGATDYFAAALKFCKLGDEPLDPNDPPEGVLMSWASDAVGGFSQEHLEVIRVTLPYLGLALKSAANRQMATDLLRVYLGRDAGQRVLSGEIQRGSSELIDAVICYFDLSGFTSMAERLPGPEMIEMLNDYFGLAVQVIQDNGGNILKFMGDGIMAMFDLGELPEDARAALGAADQLQRAMKLKNAERTEQGLPVTGFTLALHAGEILYGNIGAETRLDFTVIGPAVNQAARISGMHRSLGQDIIISQDVREAALDCGHDLVSLGRYMLRGVPEPKELFTIYQA